MLELLVASLPIGELQLKGLNWLQFFVAGGKAILLEEKVTTLFYDILQLDKAGFVLFQALLQGGHGLFDGGTVFSGWSLLCLGTNETIREDGQDQHKRFFPFGLSP